MKKVILLCSIVLLVTQSAYTKDESKEENSNIAPPKINNSQQNKVDIVDPKIDRMPDKTSKDFCKKYPTLC